eukprot:scaffold223759_cov32-Prasinocladus_malaysianus.AAC.2
MATPACRAPKFRTVKEVSGAYLQPVHRWGGTQQPPEVQAAQALVLKPAVRLRQRAAQRVAEAAEPPKHGNDLG